MCGACVFLEHVLHLRQRFPSKWSEAGPSWELPLFPDVHGEVCTKHVMVESVCVGAMSLGVNESSPDGAERITGHSLRVTGAQGLTQLGWHLLRIQLHGRWGSNVIKRYIRDSPLNVTSTISQASGSPDAWDLEAVVAAMSRKWGHRGPTVSSGSLQHLGVVSDAACAPPLADTAAQLEVERSAGTEASAVRCDMLVLNASSGTYHRRVEGSAGRSACGWSYADHLHALVPEPLAGPRCWVQLCSRCWPTWQAQAKCTGILEVLPKVA